MKPVTKLSFEVSKLLDYKDCLCLDIRPTELYARAHLPNSLSIPCSFKKSQYRKQGRLLQFKLLERHFPLLKEFAAEHIGQRLLVVYQEQGVRSELIIAYLAHIGLSVIEVQGGFKGLLSYISGFSYQRYQVQVLIGLCGSGKTERLAELAEAGEQVVDLEAMAKHRGSAFGALPLQAQPSSEQFAIDLYFHICGLNKAKALYIEYEHLFLGSVQIPVGVQSLIECGNKLWLKPSKDERVARITKDYAHLSPKYLQAGLSQVEVQISKPHFQICSKFIFNKQFKEASELLLNYYDEQYLKLFKRLGF